MSFDQPDLKPEPKVCLPYRAFLLRCWQEQTNGEPTWRFTMVQHGGGQVQRGFACLEAVMAFLDEELGNAFFGPT